MPAWSDDDAFWAAMEPALCAPGRLEAADADVAAILSAVAPPPVSRVLDLACGPGAHAIAFARLGHRVTGLDRSRLLLDGARSSARDAGLGIEWLESDMRTFRRPSSFDLVCSLYTSFGYFDDDQNRCVVENVRASLVPGGAFVLDVTGREVASRTRLGTRSHDVAGSSYREHAALSEDGSRLLTEWTVTRDGIAARFSVVQRLYSVSELEDLLLSAGFGHVTLAGGLDGRAPYDDDARRLVAIARVAGPS